MRFDVVVRRDEDDDYAATVPELLTAATLELKAWMI
jgi:predicted RNase H-like HicB family nuclease